MGANNQLAKRISYHHDLKHGEYREYLFSILKEERNYQNDKMEGTVRVYYDTGKIMEEGNYKNGIRDGVSKWYDQEGNVTIEYEYKEGQLIKK
jgi:antitoxin component YwqK of YwqJK toxin-antitoxin module